MLRQRFSWKWDKQDHPIRCLLAVFKITASSVNLDKQDGFAYSVCIEYHLKLLLFVNIPYLMLSCFIILYYDVLILYLFSALYEMSSWLWRCSQWHAIRRFLLRGGLSRLTLTQDVWTLTFFILLTFYVCITSFSNQYVI